MFQPHGKLKSSSGRASMIKKIEDGINSINTSINSCESNVPLKILNVVLDIDSVDMQSEYYPKIGKLASEFNSSCELCNR